jgi:hypothetical protein
MNLKVAYAVKQPETILYPGKSPVYNYKTSLGTGVLALPGLQERALRVLSGL